MPITVKWNRHRITFDLPSPDTKLAAIRSSLAECTHLPEHSFKLIHAGAVMKDDNAPISSYNIHDNSVIALIGTENPLPQPPSSITPETPTISPFSKSQALPKTEQSTISHIRSELSKVHTELSPSVNHFLDALTLPPPDEDTYPQHPHPTTSQEKEHNRLGELLLQSLLRLDAITTDGEWEDARRARKNAVREVQDLLDRLDGGWQARVKRY